MLYKRSKKNIIFKFEKGMLHISTPKYYLLKDLKKILELKKEWIFENLNKQIFPETHLFLGQEFENLDSIINYYNQNFDTTHKSLGSVIKEFFTVRFNHWLKLTGFEIKDLKIKKMKSAWGICYRNKNITLNLLLFCCPASVVDYVIIHELCHLKHMNHSREFWSEVEKICPDYKKHKLWLKTNGNLIFNQNYL